MASLPSRAPREPPTVAGSSVAARVPCAERVRLLPAGSCAAAGSFSRLAAEADATPDAPPPSPSASPRRVLRVGGFDSVAACGGAPRFRPRRPSSMLSTRTVQQCLAPPHKMRTEPPRANANAHVHTPACPTAPRAALRCDTQRVAPTPAPPRRRRLQGSWHLKQARSPLASYDQIVRQGRGLSRAS